ncbi:immunity protein YezG family protein [Nocardiopsis algeriensis]|uniref:DUF600 family protein n=1 Tax=Nocardiopsis algeriensis TaxID=1478215 RepID=A0A841IS85_9ACTN|nr:immunity protein YezG family protein [Nocardiopsis algeriensis]MBB6119475.1 hypothetical protein [Nocardiopsis algeriensis]
MDASQQEKLVREMALEILEGAPRGWSVMKYRYEHIGRAGAGENLVTFEDGETKRKRQPYSVIEKAISLKEGMYEKGKGTWFSMELKITRPGKFRAEFNYDREADIHPLPVSADSYALEMRKFPRDPEYIPGWLQEKLREARGKQ